MFGFSNFESKIRTVQIRISSLKNSKMWKKIPGVANDIGNNFAKAIFQILMSFGLCKKDKFLDLTSRSEI